MSELKPCPFCGAINFNEDGITAVDGSGKVIGGKGWIICESCEASGPCCYEYEEAWNARHTAEVDALKAKCAELENLAEALERAFDDIWSCAHSGYHLEDLVKKIELYADIINGVRQQAKEVSG